MLLLTLYFEVLKIIGLELDISVYMLTIDLSANSGGCSGLIGVTRPR